MYPRRAWRANWRILACVSEHGKSVELTGGPLAIDAVVAVARRGAKVSLSANPRKSVDAARSAMLSSASSGKPLYGINTGFGSFASVRLAEAQLAELQLNIVRSHSAGVGEPLDDASVRAMMVVLAASLARGHSGVRSAVIDSIIDHLNQGITPVVPSRGSVGASGDLAPLSHVALSLIGEGKASHKGCIDDTSAHQQTCKITALKLEAKEGLALLNGTHMMAGIGALAMHDASEVASAAVVAAAMALDACRATHAALDARIHDVRRQPGQIAVAAAMRRLLAGGAIADSHAEDDPRVQDPYALRAAAQVLGAAIDALVFARMSIERELGAVTDNPLVFGADGRGADVVSGANFHGMPLAIALDIAKVALCHIAGVAERRIYWALSGQDRENRLVAHMSPEPGLHSGFMIVQYAAAACCNELRTLAYPSSVGNISTCAGIEDYNSMGATSALHTALAIRLARDVVAAELLVMAQGIERQRPHRSGAGIEAAHTAIRKLVQPLTKDRAPAPDLAAISSAIADGQFAVADLALGLEPLGLD